MRLNRRVPNGTHGGVRGRGYSAPPTRLAAISKACIRSETKKVEKKIHEVELFSGVGGFDELLDIKEDIEIFAQILDRILDADYQERVQENIDLQLELERLENQRKQLAHCKMKMSI